MSQQPNSVNSRCGIEKFEHYYPNRIEAARDYRDFGYPRYQPKVIYTHTQPKHNNSQMMHMIFIALLVVLFAAVLLKK